MKIAFITNQLIIGGAEQYIITKSEWLIQNGHDVIVISEGGIWEENLPSGVTHYKLLGLMKSPYLFSKKQYNQFLNRFAEIITKSRIDIIEGQNTWPIIHVMNSYKIHKCPFYMNILSELSFNNNFLLQYATRLLDCQSLFFTLTPEMNNFISNKCRKVLNAKTINIPVKTIKKCEVSESYILSVSRMSPEKMYVKSLMHGFANLIFNYPTIEYNLVIVGDGPLFSEINRLAMDLNKRMGHSRIFIMGSIEGRNLEELFAKCSLYVGMGTTLLLAASVSKPCIRCGFEESTMSHAWGFWGEDPDSDKNEIVYSINSRHSHMESFENILYRTLVNDKLMAQMGKAAYQTFTNNYSLDSIMEIWVNEYQTIIKTWDESKIIKICNKVNFLTDIIRIAYHPYSSLKRCHL